MISKFSYIVVAILCILIGLYPLRYLLMSTDYGLLTTKSDELLSNQLWNLGFYTHIYFSGLALLTGWIQFNRNWRQKRLNLHKNLGKFYVTTALLGSISGIYIGFYATGGAISIIGFVILGVIWFYTTLKAFIHIKKGNVLAHQKTMIYSYAACFAAVTLRLWLPFLVMIFGEFIRAYQTVAWLCWVPNIFVAWILVKRLSRPNNPSSLAF